MAFPSSTARGPPSPQGKAKINPNLDAILDKIFARVYNKNIKTPIRYRGYYYDEDTKLYYLNARYYSPEFRRFISPDDTSYLDSENVNGLNLYCYCNNDPVNFVNPSGNFFFWILAISIGVGHTTKRMLSGIKAYSLRKMSEKLGNNVANRQLRAMGSIIKMGSNAVKHQHKRIYTPLSNAIYKSNWIVKDISEMLIGSIMGGLLYM